MTQELARLGSAFVTQEAGTSRWEIGNDLIRRTIAWTPEDGLRCVSLANNQSDHRWSMGTGSNEFRIRWNDAPLSGTDARSVSGTATRDDQAVELIIELDLPDALQVQAHYRCTPDNAVIQQWIEVAASAPGHLTDVTMPLAVDQTDPAILRWVHGLQPGDIGETEPGVYGSFRVRQAELGEQQIVSGLRSTTREVPWFVLSGAEGGEGFFVGLQYSGQWAAQARHADQALTFAIGPTGITAEIAAGQRWTSPRVFVGVFSGDLDDAAAVQHRFYRRVLAPPLPSDFPWVQYNTWFSYFCNFDEAVLRQEADLAADLGVEIFYVDAGWWVGNPRHGDNFSSGLGNWRETRDKFPNGLKALADHVRSRGMRFGIWVEPERVDLRTASTGSWQTDWIAMQDGKYTRVHWPKDTETSWLCFGHAPTRAWAIEWISHLITELDLAWIKWDSNWWGVCNADHHDHGRGDGEYHQVAGVHMVLDELRQRLPDLVIENCAGGGSRMDFAMAERTHVAWVNDWSEPSHRVRFHLAGASYPYPPEILNTWVAESTLEDLHHRDLPRPVLDSIFRSRMLGAMGISCRTGEWPHATRDAMRDAIAEYKQLRPLLVAGQIRHLLPQPTLATPNLPTPHAWEAYQVYDPGRQRGTILVFRGLAADGQRTIYPKGLDHDATYTVSPSDGPPMTRSGADLMAQGIACELLPLTSTLVYFAAEGADHGRAL